MGRGASVLYFATTDSTDGNGVRHRPGAPEGQSVRQPRPPIDLATGQAVGATFTNPDNLAIDAEGNIYIVEDQQRRRGDDIWFTATRTTMATCSTPAKGLGAGLLTVPQGSEFTGLYFD